MLIFLVLFSFSTWSLCLSVVLLINIFACSLLTLTESCHPSSQLKSRTLQSTVVNKGDAIECSYSDILTRLAGFLKLNCELKEDNLKSGVFCDRNVLQSSLSHWVAAEHLSYDYPLWLLVGRQIKHVDYVVPKSFPGDIFSMFTFWVENSIRLSSKFCQKLLVTLWRIIIFGILLIFLKGFKLQQANLIN